MCKILSCSDSGISFSYTLKYGFEYPYGGISISLGSDSLYQDLSKYKKCSIVMSSSSGTLFRVYLKEYIPGFTDPDNEITYRFLQYQGKTDSSLKRHDISLDAFNTPSWWYEENNLSASDAPDVDMSRIASVEIENGTDSPLDTAVIFSINRIEFKKGESGVLFYLFLLFLSASFSAAVFLFYLRNRKPDSSKQRPIPVPYRKIDLPPEEEDELNRITQYIAEHFNDPDLCVERVSSCAGVSAPKIPGLLKKRYSMNFKQYLNYIRINEGRRLLAETKENIGRIALSVGYNNISYFNSLFKKYTGLSPKEFRNKFNQS